MREGHARVQNWGPKWPTMLLIRSLTDARVGWVGWADGSGGGVGGRVIQLPHFLYYNEISSSCVNILLFFYRRDQKKRGQKMSNYCNTFF